MQIKIYSLSFIIILLFLPKLRINSHLSNP